MATTALLCAPERLCALNRERSIMNINLVEFGDSRVFGSADVGDYLSSPGVSGSLDRIIFNACDFDNYSDVSAVTTSPRTTLRDCRNTPPSSPFFVPTVHA